ncbi:MAG: kelch repeat-containing protein [Terriglobales bacterium]
MTTRRLVRILVVVLVFCATVPRLSAAVQASNVAAANGQTATLLPKGGILLAGGQDATGHASAALWLRDLQGTERQLQAALQIARTGHTATVLPDGTVLILGGIGADGQLVQSTEIFDPQTESSQLLSSSAPSARAFHSATVLTDGRVLIFGGVGANGDALASAELWDPRNQTVTAISSAPAARRNHTASLLPDGRVLLSGGKDAGGISVSLAEVFDPQSQRFSTIADSGSVLSANGQAGQAQAFSPQDGAADVAVDALIALRFSRPLRMESISDQTVVLNGPFGMVEARITGAEAGMLAFITPQSPLVPGTTYLVRLSGAVDSAGTSVVFKEFTFTTAGDAAQSDVWNPTLDWMTHNSPSSWQNLPPLQARAGVTALAGQMLKLDGTPLAHVKLQVGAQAVFSDGTGRFLLKDLPAGHNVMMIFGDSANTPLRKYGVYEVGIEIKSGITNILSYVIWMTPLDTAHVVKIPSPTMSETVVTSPLLPGLELHLPANTVITDSHGNTVTEITITPVPLDRPPFPLPNVPVPIYFTIQPGVSYIKVLGSSGPKGARLFYPNAHMYPPRTPFQFWNYDAGQKGWFIYGQGHVSPDRSQVIPDPGVEIYEFTGAMVSNPGNGPPDGPRHGNHNKDGEPVDLGTGLFVYEKTDLVLPDLIPLVLSRTYRQNDPISRSFGVGTGMPYDMFMVGDNNTFPEGYTFQDLILADGSRIHFPRTSPCTGANGYCDFGNAVYEHTSSESDFYGAVIRFQGCSPSGSWTLTKKDGTVYCFPDSDASNNGRSAAPNGMHDRYGNSLTFTRDGNHNLTQITSPNGRWIQFTYDSGNRITQAQDNIGRTVTYSYDVGGRLIRVVDANGGVWNYTYDAFNQMTSIQDARGIVYLTNQYDQNGRVIKQTQGDNSNFLFSYTTDPTTGNIIQTDVTEPLGSVKRSTFNANGYTSSVIFALGQPEQETITYSRDPNTNLIASLTDGLSHHASFTYDSFGNLTSVTRMAGTPDATTISFTFESNFNQLASITDPLNHITTFSHDANGSLTTVTDPLGHQTNIAYAANGLPVSIIDALSNVTQFAYDGTDLVGVTDPVGNTTTRFIDAAGRLAAVSDPLGNVTRYTYNALNEVVLKVDPIQGQTSVIYDQNGNALSQTDPRGNSTTWTYDNMDRMATRTDPLLRQQSYKYDVAGNLVSFTDRKGQVTTYKYDKLNRLIFVGFGTQGSGGSATYASTTSYQYDAGNRVTQAVDSVAGILTHTYDTLDRLISEVTPQGSITYSYDAAGRRTAMNVLGQPSVSYSYDSANRLLQMAQGAMNVSFTYDDADRRASVVLPNGTSISYGYDSGSRVTGITYNFGGSALGNITYSYDQLGRRTQMGGSFARTNLPGPIIAAAYDAANELTMWNGIPLSYDANGNMLSDGSNSFTWDPRNHLAALNGNSLKYDAFNRRTQNAAGTSFLYDMANAIQELSGSTVTANSLTGGIDEIFARTTSSGTYGVLQDNLHSTLALTDGTGAIQASYTYGPFGATSITGLTGINPFQFNGRENEGNGLYFYRARYYNSVLGRFISEDPIGFNGHDLNLYAYVGDSPQNFTDPSGKNPIIAIVVGLGALAGGIDQGVKGYDCGDRGWNLAGDILRGAVSGAAGSFVGLVTSVVTENPALGGAAGSFVNDGFNAGLSGHSPSGEEVLGNMAWGAVMGPLAEGFGEGFSPVRGGSNFDPLTSPRTFGPKASQLYNSEGFSHGADLGRTMAGRNCDCN